MINIFKIALCAIILTSVVSCSKSDDDNFKKGYGNNLKSLNITDATNLVIVTSKESSTTKSVKSEEYRETNVLYKITEDGVLKQVSHIDKEGNVVSDNKYYQPLEIKNLNDDYVLLCYSTPYDHSNNLHNYIARKSDGAVFEAPLAVNREQAKAYYCAQDFNIGNEDFYFLGLQHISTSIAQAAIFNLFVDNSGGIFEKQISLESDGVSNYFDDFYADVHGNYIYSLDDVNYGKHRIIAKSGSINSQENLNAKAVGPDGYIYSINEKDVFKLVIEDDASITKELYGTLSEDIDLNHFYKFGDKILCIEPSGKVVDIFGAGSDIIVHNPVNGLISGEVKVMVSGDYYFFAGYSGAQLKIFRMDVNTHLPEEMPVDFSQFEFNLDNVMMINENEVMCSGLRLQDAAWVNYKADFNGNIELLDEDFHNMEVVQLERIQ